MQSHAVQQHMLSMTSLTLGAVTTTTMQYSGNSIIWIIDAVGAVVTLHASTLNVMSVSWTLGTSG